eukprot:g1433.t1
MPPPAVGIVAAKVGVKALARTKIGAGAYKFGVFVVRYAARWMPYYVTKYSLILLAKRVPAHRAYRVFARMARHHCPPHTARGVMEVVKRGLRAPAELHSVLANQQLGRLLQTIAAEPAVGVYVGHSPEAVNTARAARLAARAATLAQKLEVAVGGSAGGGKRFVGQAPPGKINWRKEAAMFAGSILLMASLHAYWHPEEVWQEIEEIEHGVEHSMEGSLELGGDADPAADPDLAPGTGAARDPAAPPAPRGGGSAGASTGAGTVGHEAQARRGTGAGEGEAQLEAQLLRLRVRLDTAEEAAVAARAALLGLDARVLAAEQDIGIGWRQQHPQSQFLV